MSVLSVPLPRLGTRMIRCVDFNKAIVELLFETLTANVWIALQTTFITSISTLFPLACWLLFLIE
jgi:hypothetical protein